MQVRAAKLSGRVCSGRGLLVFRGRLLAAPRSVQNATSCGLSMADWNPTLVGVALSSRGGCAQRTGGQHCPQRQGRPAPACLDRAPRCEPTDARTKAGSRRLPHSIPVLLSESQYAV